MFSIFWKNQNFPWFQNSFSYFCITSTPLIDYCFTHLFDFLTLGVLVLPWELWLKNWCRLNSGQIRLKQTYLKKFVPGEKYLEIFLQCPPYRPLCCGGNNLPPSWDRVNCLAKNWEGGLKPLHPSCLRQPCHLPGASRAVRGDYPIVPSQTFFPWTRIVCATM